jgi:hypothetical protein
VHDRNGHFRERWSLEALRASIVRTSTTHRHLITHARALGLGAVPDDPDEVASVTAVAQRLISVRMDGTRHPIPGDRSRHLVSLGLRAAAGRHDLSWPRRTLIAGWFPMMALVPRRAVPGLGRPVVHLDV